MNKLNIAIDGYAGCGKSTLARDLARSLGFTFVDTGALYRGITYMLLRDQVKIEEEGVVAHLGEQMPQLRFQEGSNHLLLDGEDIEQAIRTDQAIAQNVSQVAALSAVRAFLVNIQQEFVAQRGIVMEGRDIGTVVMPEADVKLFITASMEERVHRRLEQLKQAGQSITRTEVEKNLLERDQKDAGRSIAPLRKADDAMAIDTSRFDRDQQLEACLALIRPHLDPEEFLRFIPR